MEQYSRSKAFELKNLICDLLVLNGEFEMSIAEWGKTSRKEEK